MKWIYRGGRADLVPDDQAGDYAPLIAAVKGPTWLPGQVQVFIHGEAQTVMHNLRPYIRNERGVDAKWASISGYWRRGRTEETFRQWKRELAEAEASAIAGRSATVGDVHRPCQAVLDEFAAYLATRTGPVRAHPAGLPR